MTALFANPRISFFPTLEVVEKQDRYGPLDSSTNIGLSTSKKFEFPEPSFLPLA